MAEYIEREALLERIDGIWDCADMVFEPNDYCCRADDCASCKWAETKNAIRKIVANFPAADVPPALWTDEPISGTEFMTHNQGQSGFKIHFRTDDKAKYEAVQEECRRQIDHAKPAADVRPVVRCRECKHWFRNGTDLCSCDMDALIRHKDFFCAAGERITNGEKMEGE